MEINTFEYFKKNSIGNPKAYIAASETKLISHYKYGFIYNYVKLNISDDDSVKIAVRYLNPKTFEIVMEETFYTIVNSTDNAGGVFLFSKNQNR